MPNGKPGDHPLTDLLIHGRHPFPGDIEDLILTIVRLDPRAFSSPGEIDRWPWFDWENGERLDEARTLLRAKLHEVRTRQSKD